MNMHTTTAALPRPITTIRMSAAAFDLRALNPATGEAVSLDLSTTTRVNKEALAATLCQLHGIGTPRQWAHYRHALAKEHKAEHEAFKARRKAFKLEKVEKQARLAKDAPKRRRRERAGRIAVGAAQ